MDRLYGTISDIADIKGGDSFCDRLNSRYTTFILVIFAVMVTTKHYVGEPIGCWCPAHFEDSHVDYTNKVCWVTNTYYLPFDREIPRRGEPRKLIGYYQWVPLVLTGQAILFYLPRVIWRVFNRKSGIAITTITEAALQCQRKTDADDRDKTLRYMTKHMGRFLHELNRKHLMSNFCKGLWWRIYGNYLVILYLVIKLLYISNVIGQFFLLNKFLGTDFNLYGFHVLKRVAKGDDWTTSEQFPRVTMCDFEVRVLGNVQDYTVQCALPINLFNEIIYIFIWFWFAFIAFATVGSFVLWCFQLVYIPTQKSYVASRLIAMDKFERVSRELLHGFVTEHLRRDGVFIIWLVSKNASDVIAAELLCGLWDHYKGRRNSIETIRRQQSKP